MLQLPQNLMEGSLIRVHFGPVCLTAHDPENRGEPWTERMNILGSDAVGNCREQAWQSDPQVA